MSGCCDEYACKRAKPYRVRLTPFGRRWVLITDYTERPGGYIAASRKHDIHDDLIAALIAEGWTPPSVTAGETT